MAPEKPLDLSSAKVVPPWYKQQWLLWLSMVIFPPLGIGLTWLTDWSPKRKKVTSGAGVAWFALMLASGGPEAEIAVDKQQSAPEQQVSSRSAVPREAISFGMLFPDEMKSESGTSRLTQADVQGELRITQALDEGNVDGVLTAYERIEGDGVSYTGEFQERDQAGTCSGSFEIRELKQYNWQLKRTYKGGNDCEFVGDTIATDFYKLGSDGELMGVTSPIISKNSTEDFADKGEEPQVSSQTGNRKRSKERFQESLPPEELTLRQFLLSDPFLSGYLPSNFWVGRTTRQDLIERGFYVNKLYKHVGGKGNGDSRIAKAACSPIGFNGAFMCNVGNMAPYQWGIQSDKAIARINALEEDWSILYTQVQKSVASAIENETNIAATRLPESPNVIGSSSENSISRDFPKTTCGDPASPGAEWFPVFVDNGDLESIRAEWCSDAIAKTRPDTGVSAVQLASFTDSARAGELASLVGGEVGESYFLDN